MSMLSNSHLVNLVATEVRRQCGGGGGQLGGSGRGSLAEAQLQQQRQRVKSKEAWQQRDELRKQTKEQNCLCFVHDTLHVKRSLKYCAVLSSKNLRSFIHPNLMDFYVGFCWFTRQTVHFLATR
jgi:hypothetical protein